MSRYFVQPVDPTELSSRFSNEKSLDPLPGMNDQWKKEHLEKIKGVLDYLPEIEEDYIRLYYLKDKKQVDIAEIFDVTQAAVSYRIKRGEERLRFILDMPSKDKEEVYQILLDEGMEDQNASIFREMYETSCQTEVADRLGLGQGCVRHRFLNNLEALGEHVASKIDGWTDLLEEEDTPPFLRDVNEEVQDAVDEKEAGDIEVEEFEDRMLEAIGTLNRKKGTLDDLDQFEEVLDTSLIYRSFVKIRYNFNILREVELPKWSQNPGKKIT
jgi:DNA-directed RNA polymerase specialized sigma24 family protein